MSIGIDLALPASALGFREPSVPWKAIKARVRRASDAHISPDRSVWLLDVGDNLVLTRARGGSPLITLPRANVVMVQWAIGPHVMRWDDVLARR